MNTQHINPVPEGYKRNAAGHLVPEANIKEQDLLRDDLVNTLAAKAIVLHDALTVFKKLALTEIADLVTVAGDRYGVNLGGKKGNVSLLSFDGRFKVSRQYREVVAFTEEIEAAKALIDSCLERWSEGADIKIKAVVSQAFRTNTKGEIKTGKVLDLMRMDIDDEEWTRAMNALKDALQSVGTAVYVRLYERVGESDNYRPISLDIASL
jgi:hypothetical protein